MPSGTKYRTNEFDSHFSVPCVAAAMASLVRRDTAKFSSSQVLFFTNSMHAADGTGEVHSPIPNSNRRLNAVQPKGRGTRYQLPPAVRSLRIGRMLCMHAGAALQS